jgi:hypothetical protein
MNWFKKAKTINTEEDARLMALKYNVHYNGVQESLSGSVFLFTTLDDRHATFAVSPGGDIGDAIVGVDQKYNVKSEQDMPL